MHSQCCATKRKHCPHSLWLSITSPLPQQPLITFCPDGLPVSNISRDTSRTYVFKANLEWLAFLWLNNTPLYGSTTLCSPIYLLIDIWDSLLWDTLNLSLSCLSAFTVSDEKLAVIHSEHLFLVHDKSLLSHFCIFCFGSTRV